MSSLSFPLGMVYLLGAKLAARSQDHNPTGVSYYVTKFREIWDRMTTGKSESKKIS